MGIAQRGQPVRVAVEPGTRIQIGDGAAQQRLAGLGPRGLGVPRDQGAPGQAVDVEPNQDIGAVLDRRGEPGVAGRSEREPAVEDVEPDDQCGQAGAVGNGRRHPGVAHRNHHVQVRRHRAGGEAAPLPAEVVVPPGDDGDDGARHARPRR